MDNFWKRHFSKWAIALLLILNVSTLSILWYKEINRPPRPPRGPSANNSLNHRERMERFIERELNLNKDQSRQFRKLHSAYLQQSRGLRNEIRDLKRRQLRTEMFKTEPDTLKMHQTARRIAEKQFELERQTFLHFQGLKTLVGEDQVESLKALLDEIFMPQGNSRTPRGPRPKLPNDKS